MVANELEGISKYRYLTDEEQKQEALRMTRLVLTLRFGGLSHQRSQALEQLDTDALETVIFEAFNFGSTLTIQHLQTHHLEASTPAPGAGIRDSQGKPVRLSPLGGYRTT